MLTEAATVSCQAYTRVMADLRIKMTWNAQAGIHKRMSRPFIEPVP